MKRSLFITVIIIFTIACVRVPITKRKQLKLLPEDQLIGMADTAYQQFLDTSQVLNPQDPRATRVRNVGEKIKVAVESYLNKHNASSRIRGFNWKFNTVNSKTINAWCMPGGKVVVYTGILELATDDDLLAVVMGHEIAHAIARHGNERMSQGLALQGLGYALGGMMQNPVTRNIFLQSYGIGSALGMLKYSRTHESEADKMGLVFMYLAGYKPETAVAFWEKMAENGSSVPELLSTHPSDQTRIADIKKFLPEIPKYAN